MGREVRRADPVIGEEVRRLTVGGFSAEQIAAALGVSSRTVVRYRRAQGVAGGPPSTRRMGDADRAQLLALFDQGLSREEVHRTTGWSRAALAHHFPDRRWERVECARHGALVRNLGRVLA